jgi:predicted nuclease with TOPRIM domain
MKGILGAGVVLAVIGCADVSRQDVETVKAELLANDARMVAELKRDLTGIDQKYVTVQQLQQDVRKQLDEMAKLHKDLTELGKHLEVLGQVAAGQVLKALQFEEKMMSERLAELRLLIEELKKK